MSNLPSDASAMPGTPRRDLGAWLSGPGINTAQVPARDVQPGDRLITDDGLIAEITVIRPAAVRLQGGGYAPGVALWWQQRGGARSGVMVRGLRHTPARIKHAWLASGS